MNFLANPVVLWPSAKGAGSPLGRVVVGRFATVRTAHAVSPTLSVSRHD